MKTNLHAWIILHNALHSTPRRIHNLINLFGSVENIIDTLKSDETKLNLNTNQLQRLKNSYNIDTTKIDKWLNASDRHHILTYDRPSYPNLLRQIADPPPLLYIIGDIKLLHNPQIAIVGSRKPTQYGQTNAIEITKSLAKNDLTITSGMARGIDTHVHKATLDIDGKTIAVLGCGANKAYPQSNAKLYHDICNKGVVISELPLDTPPRADHFPRRNRIISGLSLGTLVVEAAAKSGSLITAYAALEQNRDVFAIPGSIRNHLSQGCHQLIQSGAKLITKPQDILTELNIPPRATPDICTETNDTTLEKTDHILLECLGFDTWSVQDLIDKTGIPAQMICSQLLKLELHGYILSVPGGYSRVK